MTEPLKGAVIGAGYFSQFHFDAWARLQDVEIVACCDADLAKLDAAAARFGITHVYTDFRQLLDEQQLDFVDVITRPDTHLEICRETTARGLATICQKPLAPTAADAIRLVQFAQQADARFMVHENFRFQPWYREIKNLCEQGTVGDRLHTLTFRNRAGDGWGDDAYLARQPYFQTMQRFLVFEAGIHTIDTFRFLAGDVARVWAHLRRLNPVIAGEDAAIAIFEFENGGMGVYDANRYNESTAADQRYTFGEMQVEGSAGTIRLYDDGRLTVQKLGDTEQEHRYAPSRSGFGGDSVYAIQRHFVDAFRSGERFETDGPNYLRSIQVQEAAYRSATSGQWESPDSPASSEDPNDENH